MVRDHMRLSAHDYIDLMESLGRFSRNAAIPELNSLMWRHYLALYKEHIGDPDDIVIVASADGLGFYVDPLDCSQDYKWALLGPVSHARIPFTAREMVDNVPNIAAAFDTAGIETFRIMTDAFALAAPAAPEQEVYFGWINSPQARLFDDFEAYTASLSASRRKQMRRLGRAYDAEGGFRFDLSDHPPDETEKDFIISQTTRCWGEAWEYALALWIWQIAAAEAVPSCARFMRVYSQDRLVFLNGYIVRDDTIFSQSTCRSMDCFFSGLGTSIDFKAIEFLCGSPDIRFLDPTCGTGLYHPESISVAKREVVNSNCRRPFLCLGTADTLASAEKDHRLPVFESGAGWRNNDAVFVTGREA